MNFFEAIKNHLRLGLLIVFIVPAMAWIIALSITPIFESRARLLIEVKDLGFEGQQAQPFRTIARASDPIQTQIEILRSATILDKVIRQFNMRYESGSRKGQYLSYLNLNANFAVSADRNVDVVELKFKHSDPNYAKHILQAITDSYIEKTIELKASDTASAIRFLKKERNKAEREALEASKRLREFEHKSKTISLESNQEIVKSLYSLRSIKLTAESEHVKAKTASEQITKQLMSSLSDSLLNITVSEDPFLTALRKDLYEKETQLVRLQTKVKSGHYQLEEIKQQIEGDKKLIEERVKELVGKQVNLKSFSFSNDPVRAELTRNLLQTKTAELAIKEQLKVIDEALDEVLKKLEKLPNEKYIYTQLLRQNDIAEKRLEEIEKKLIESRMKGVIASHITNIRLIDPPSLATSPIHPNIPFALFSSFIFGLILALIVVYIVEYFDDVIKGVDTLPSEMGCPFLGQLPQVHIGDLPIVYQEPRSEYTESIHALRTNLSFLSLSGNKKLLLITSPSVHEGKSTVSLNLAITYAQSGKRVLLIDSDIRNPSLYKYLARPKDTVGISNTLINEIDFYDVVQKSILGIIGFDYLPSGEIPPNPIQLLESDRMRELLETAQHIYDLVILDTPPLGLFSDALLLARYVDVVGLVSRYNKTSRKELMAAIDLLKKSNVTAIGVVLNSVPSGATGTYGYGYGYYGYGESERYAKGESAA
ncbi:MAG: polysaccharide biosynthesis tyrosine autokinase [Candidatus Melainabacteria bacterium]|nr:polysaccharide biosynthesis tyrosine autokinase [Candidatus Melainabacteria bacterium]